jgi:hypothetical protein
MKPRGQISPWGQGAVRAMYPSSLGGPFGSPGQSLPAYGLNSAYYGYPGYSGSGVYMEQPKSNFGKRACSFGSSTRSLTPGGVTTQKSMGFYKYGSKKKRKCKKSKVKSKKRGVKRSVRKKRSVKRKRKRSVKSKFGKCPVCK